MLSKICVSNSEVKMESHIEIHARVRIETAAKVDYITVANNCKCDDKVKPLVEMVILVDGSDSYNDITGMGGSAFKKTLQLVSSFLQACKATDRVVVTLVQFSGIKQLEKDYVPGSNGHTSSGIKMYNIEVSPTSLAPYKDQHLSDIMKYHENIDGLDGNGQLFLCLQDLSMPNFLGQLDEAQTPAANQERERVLVIFSEVNWDCIHLQDGFGSGTTTAATVVEHVHKAYSAVYPCILRSEDDQPNNVEFINKMAQGGEVHHITTQNWKQESANAIKRIISALGLE